MSNKVWVVFDPHGNAVYARDDPNHAYMLCIPGGYIKQYVEVVEDEDTGDSSMGIQYPFKWGANLGSSAEC